jgi:uncharacterized membrane protein (UPF0127 family)
MQHRTKIFIGLIVAMIVLLILAWYTWPQETTSVPAVPAVTSATTTTSSASSATTTSASVYPPPSLGETNGIVTIGGQTIYVDLAENPAQQELGLGNRAALGAHQGMLFIFPTDDIHMFWMKDMSFSIDMIWFSADGTVIYIAPNVAPSTYPDAFGPNEVSRYVLEVPANFAATYGIKVGNQATLP